MIKKNCAFHNIIYFCIYIYCDSYSLMDIKQTVGELVFGDAQKAMENLYLYYHSKLMLFVSYYVKSKHDAEEIVSDTLYDVWEQRQNLAKVQNFNTYIYAIAKNHISDFLSYKKKNNMHIVKYEDEEVELVPSSSNPETDLISKDLLDRLNEAIESLPTQKKITFKLVREMKLKYKEAAEVMGISVKTLETHIIYAMKRLEKILDEEQNS